MSQKDQGITEYEPQSSHSILASVQCRTYTQQGQLLDGDHAVWLSLCLLCLNHLAGTTVFFSFIGLNLSHLANKQETSINAEIHPRMLTGNCKCIQRHKSIQYLEGASYTSKIITCIKIITYQGQMKIFTWYILAMNTCRI